MMLTIENLNQYYGSSHTLRDVSLNLPVGKCTTLLGRNGVGKTTFLKCLMGVLPIASGKVSIYGEEIGAWKPHRRAAHGIAYVPQGREIFSRLTVEENIRMGMAVKKASQAKSIPDYVYTLFPVLKEMRQRRGGDLSGGQQQQLAIARALVGEPKVLILDEPTEGIQPSIIKDIERVIRLLTERGDMAILLVEQYYDFAERLADYFAVMTRGEIVLSGEGKDMAQMKVRTYLAV
jgi:urea transport system ATP-binding protein